jgi:hypothetical protein
MRPELSPGRKHLPWALLRLREKTALRPERAGRAHGVVSAKGAGARICHGVGTSATARSRNASGKSGAGRRHGARPNVAGIPQPNAATPKPKESAVSEPRPLRSRRLRRRVVTQQKLFFPSPLQSARLPPSPRGLTPYRGTLLLFRVPSGGPQRERPGTQMAISRHRGRPEEARLRVSRCAPAPIRAATQHLH